jgi:ketol-acid reductoisomerase
MRKLKAETKLSRLAESGKKHQIEEVGARLRGLMPWLAATSW